MGAMWLYLRSATRLRWRGLLGLALLAGLMGGIALTAAAGAQRTDTAYPRLLRSSHASQLLVTPTVGGFDGFFRALRGLPEVRRMATTAFYDMAIQAPGHPLVRSVVFEGSPTAPPESPSTGSRIISGRPFSAQDPQRGDDRHAAGPPVPPASWQHAQARRLPADANRSAARHGAVPLAFTVSAVVIFADQVVPATHELAEPTALLSPAFARTPAAQSYNPGGGAASVLLRRGASQAAFTEAATALRTRFNVGGVGIVNLATQYAATQRAIRPQAIALAIFAALAGLIGLAVVAQLLGRQIALDGVEFPILRALGMSRSKLAIVSLARAGLVTITAGTVAIAFAVAASPLMPIGPARIAETDSRRRGQHGHSGRRLRRDRAAAAPAGRTCRVARRVQVRWPAGRRRPAGHGASRQARAGAAGSRLGHREHRRADGT